MPLPVLQETVKTVSIEFNKPRSPHSTPSSSPSSSPRAGGRGSSPPPGKRDSSPKAGKRGSSPPPATIQEVSETTLEEEQHYRRRSDKRGVRGRALDYRPSLNSKCVNFIQQQLADADVSAVPDASAPQQAVYSLPVSSHEAPGPQRPRSSSSASSELRSSYGGGFTTLDTTAWKGADRQDAVGDDLVDEVDDDDEPTQCYSHCLVSVHPQQSRAPSHCKTDPHPHRKRALEMAIMQTNFSWCQRSTHKLRRRLEVGLQAAV